MRLYVGDGPKTGVTHIFASLQGPDDATNSGSAKRVATQIYVYQQGDAKTVTSWWYGRQITRRERDLTLIQYRDYFVRNPSSPGDKWLFRGTERCLRAGKVAERFRPDVMPDRSTSSSEALGYGMSRYKMTTEWVCDPFNWESSPSASVQ